MYNSIFGCITCLLYILNHITCQVSFKGTRGVGVPPMLQETRTQLFHAPYKPHLHLSKKFFSLSQQLQQRCRNCNCFTTFYKILNWFAKVQLACSLSSMEVELKITVSTIFWVKNLRTDKYHAQNRAWFEDIRKHIPVFKNSEVECNCILIDHQ